AGTRPVIRFQEEGEGTYEPRMRVNGSLVLQGIEFQCVDERPVKLGKPALYDLFADGPSLRIANCRFQWPQVKNANTVRYHTCIGTNTTVCDLRNCEFLIPAEVAVEFTSQTLSMTNCTHVGHLLTNYVYANPERKGVEVRLTGNTVVTRNAQMLHTSLG